LQRKITIDPLTRVEGHGKVTIKLDEHNNVQHARLHIVEFRGFERFIQGRPYWEAPVLVQRLCGICPVSHHLAASKAMDMIVGASKEGAPTVTAEKIRRLMHYGQFFQSHILHFFHLVSPDLIFGVDADPAKRNIAAVAMENPELAKQAVLMRKFGQDIIKLTAGKKIHGTGSIPGGVNKSITKQQQQQLLLGDDTTHGIDQMIDWSLGALDFFKSYHKLHRDLIDNFAYYPSNHLSLVSADGGLDIYHGNIRAVDADGVRILDDISYHDYTDYIAEEVRNWSYMKFPYIKHIGKEKGWYRVGPMARLSTIDHIPTPLAQKEYELYADYSGGKPHANTMHMHWARLIETLHAAEMIKVLLQDDDLTGNDLQSQGSKTYEGVGVIEAPRGTLFHHYQIDEDDLITLCNLIVSTTQNNIPMNEAVQWVAHQVIEGHDEIPESMLNQVEVAIRAYDPCLSCATHAMGKMPLQVILEDHLGKQLDEKFKH